MSNKLYDYAKNVVLQTYVTPEMFGAVGDGAVDDSSAIQSAINKKGWIVFGSGKTYKVTSTLRISKDTILDLNGATINSTNKHLLFNFQNDSVFTGYNGNGNIVIRNGTIIGGAISFGHGENIRLDNVKFKDSLNDHFLEIAGCKNYVINGCEFVGMADVQTSVYEYINLDPCVYNGFPWLPSSSAFYDGTKNNKIEVRDSYFALGENTYAYGFNAFGVHGEWNANTFHENIKMVNNTIRGFTGCGIRLNNMKSIYLAGNDIQVSGDGVRVGDVANVIDATIIDNYIVPGNSSQMIALTSGRYTGLTVSGNVAKGAS